MTSDELKQSVSMREVLQQYDIVVNRAGMCSCPFHGRDKHPSMKVYKDGYHCFTCGKNGDIFSFVQDMDNCDFKTAFLKLGGHYSNGKKLTFAEKQRLDISKNMAERRAMAKIKEKEKKHELFSAITDYKAYLSQLEPFSDEWCNIQNDLNLLVAWLDSKIYEDCEVDTSGIISRYRKFKQKRDSIR